MSTPTAILLLACLAWPAPLACLADLPMPSVYMHEVAP